MSFLNRRARAAIAIGNSHWPIIPIDFIGLRHSLNSGSRTLSRARAGRSRQRQSERTRSTGTQNGAGNGAVFVLLNADWPLP